MMDLEKVRWVAHLARLELDEGTLKLLSQQLGAILDYVDQLKAISTDGVEPMAHPLVMSNVFRDDELAPSLSVDEALANAPVRSGNFFGVPAVLD